MTDAQAPSTAVDNATCTHEPVGHVVIRHRDASASGGTTVELVILDDTCRISDALLKLAVDDELNGISCELDADRLLTADSKPYRGTLTLSGVREQSSEIDRELLPAVAVYELREHCAACCSSSAERVA